jgi:uncharacterized Ntn-hydrolase superfamily protein
MLLVLAGPGAAPAPLAHTFSIVARDPATGEMGVAVQSHYFSVGPVVPWAAAGVGAVATQSLVLVDYGPNGLELMKGGMSAQQALDSLLKADAHNEGRQVAMIDAKGTVAAYTGKNCIPDAGHKIGTNYSVQANLMANANVWPAMSAAFEKAQGDLGERMLQALEAGQKAGGDIRGMQSSDPGGEGEERRQAVEGLGLQPARRGFRRADQGAAPPGAAPARLHPQHPGR